MRYTADDGDGASAPATVSLTITRAPACDGDPLTLATVTGPAHGSLGTIDQGTGAVTYTPNPAFTGPDSFTYGTASLPAATVSISVIGPPNTAPEWQPVSRQVTTGTATAVRLDCTDPDGDALTLETVDGPAHGTLAGVDQGANTVAYTPGAGFTGSDEFTSRAADGDLQSGPVTVSLTVTAPPTVTLAVDRASAAEGSTLAFTAPAADPDGGAIAEYRYAVDGAVVQTGGRRKLSRRFDGPGSHVVTVRAKDDEGQTAMATKTITITERPAPDTTPPAATLAAPKQKLEAVIAKGLALRAACGERCTLKLQLVVDKATAKKLKLGRKAMAIGTLIRSVSGSTKLKIKLTAKARKALKKARHLKLAVRATATDGVGNVAAMTKRLRL